MVCGRVAGILLAAGAGSRFGGNKLEAALNGELLGLHAARTLARVGCGHLLAVHDPAQVALAEALAALGYQLIPNTKASAGMGHSLALAVQAAQSTDADAILVCLADMPFVTADHLSAIIAIGTKRVIASSNSTTRMPPALFPRSYWPILAQTAGDSGARALLKDAAIVMATPDMLADIDYKSDLNRLLST